MKEFSCIYSSKLSVYWGEGLNIINWNNPLIDGSKFRRTESCLWFFPLPDPETFSFFMLEINIIRKALVPS